MCSVLNQLNQHKFKCNSFDQIKLILTIPLIFAADFSQHVQVETDYEDPFFDLFEL